MGHTFSKHLYHVVFSTKGRERWLAASARPRLFDYMAGIAQRAEARLLSLGGTEDHVHALIELPPDKSVSDFVRTLKANSSRWLRRTVPGFGGFAWQAGYSSFSVSRSAAQRIAAYVNDQPEHHRKRDFGAELARLLSRHGIEFDPDHYLD